MVENREMFECCQIWHQMINYTEGHGRRPSFNGQDIKLVQMVHATLAETYAMKFGRPALEAAASCEKLEKIRSVAAFAPEIIALEKIGREVLDSRFNRGLDAVTKEILDIRQEETSRRGKPVNAEFSKLRMIGYV